VLEDEWQKEKDLVDKILELRGKLRAGTVLPIDEPAESTLSETDIQSGTRKNERKHATGNPYR
jgi:hypothetical protein